MNLEEIKAVKTLLSTTKSIVIVPHKNPDGDAIGSTLALWHYLKNSGHNALIIAPNDYPSFLKWLPEEHQILMYESHQKQAEKLIVDADLIFTLDFNALHRTGNMEATLAKSSATKIMIDHHQQPDSYATYMYSDVNMSSTCEMVYNFIDFLEDTDRITPEIATCIYTGIMTDTGSFRFRSTTSKTHQIIAKLIEKGADNTDIHNQVYDKNSFERMKLLGVALQNLNYLAPYNTAYITLSQDELNSHQFKKGDTEGFVNYGLSLEGVKLAAIFIENKQEEIIKISLRSKGNFSVNHLARAHFNGGGHTNAAGGKSITTLKETVEKFISILPSYKSELS